MASSNDTCENSNSVENPAENNADDVVIPQTHNSCACCNNTNSINSSLFNRTEKIDSWIQTPHWNDWHWQLKNRMRSIADVFPHATFDKELYDVPKKYPMAITPYYASLIRSFDDKDPILKMSFPSVEELHDSLGMNHDPLHEEEYMPVPNLVHRYPNRCLILSTTTCAMYCRHCTRKRLAGQREVSITDGQLQRVCDYIARNKQIDDVIISGGDPLTLDDDKLEKILSSLRAIPHVGIIRIGTRTPITLPMRITSALTDMLKKYHPLYINTHFNHPNEVSPDAERACTKLADAGIVLGNQSVLLRGVNNDHTILAALYKKLLTLRVRPYYLYQCDLVRGVNQFRTPLEEGIAIMEKLYGYTSGLAIPTFIVDLPNGGGKIPVTPHYIQNRKDGIITIKNFEGNMIPYQELEHQ